MKELQLNELDNIKGGVAWGTPAQIANECKTYNIYDPLVYNANGSLNVAATTDSALGNDITEGIESIASDCTW